MFLRKDNSATRTDSESMPIDRVAHYFHFLACFLFAPLDYRVKKNNHTEEDVGLLVQVSFYITAFTLPAYQRGSLPRPSKDDSS